MKTTVFILCICLCSLSYARETNDAPKEWYSAMGKALDIRIGYGLRF